MSDPVVIVTAPQTILIVAGGQQGPQGPQGPQGEPGEAGPPGGSADLGAGTEAELIAVNAAGTAFGRAGSTIAALLAAARDRATHTGTQLASAISDFAAQVLALLSWGNISGKPSTFPPESHTHAATQVSDSTATGRAVMTAADAAAARTAIGAESAGAAAVAVSAHEAALDPHTQYTTAAEAAAAAPVQSVAGRTGAVTLGTSDVSGLGGAAVLNVGTTAGTVAAGDDARLSDARTPTAHTHPLGDLQQSGAASGNVPTWNGSEWVPQAPAGGSGGERRYDESGNHQYVGQAPAGSAEGAAVWTIRRLTYSSGVYVETLEASAVTWTGRAGHTYA